MLSNSIFSEWVGVYTELKSFKPSCLFLFFHNRIVSSTKIVETKQIQMNDLAFNPEISKKKYFKQDSLQIKIT